MYCYTALFDYYSKINVVLSQLIWAIVTFPNWLIVSHMLCSQHYLWFWGKYWHIEYFRHMKIIAVWYTRHHVRIASTDQQLDTFQRAWTVLENSGQAHVVRLQQRNTEMKWTALLFLGLLMFDVVRVVRMENTTICEIVMVTYIWHSKQNTIIEEGRKWKTMDDSFLRKMIVKTANAESANIILYQCFIFTRMRLL